MTVLTERPALAPSMLSDSLLLGPYPSAVPAARLHTRSVLDSRGLAELASDAETVVSELVANAVEAHRRSRIDAPVRLTLIGGLRTVLIVVRDSSLGAPVAGRPGDWEESGRGLLLVEALSWRWDWKRLPAPAAGKVVRAVIRPANPIPGRSS